LLVPTNANTPSLLHRSIIQSSKDDLLIRTYKHNLARVAPHTRDRQDTTITNAKPQGRGRLLPAGISSSFFVLEKKKTPFDAGIPIISIVKFRRLTGQQISSWCWCWCWCCRRRHRLLTLVVLQSGVKCSGHNFWTVYCFCCQNRRVSL
jgi:hypothetical protein